MAAFRYTDTDRQRVLTLHGEGRGRNDIARDTGYSTKFISETVHKEGKSFARTEQVQAATAAKTIDNKSRRVAIIARLYGQAEAVLDRLENPATYKTITKGEKGLEIVETLDFIPPTDRRNELTSVGISLDKAITLEKVDGDNGTERAESMLDKLSADMKEAARNALRNVGQTDPHDSDL